MGKNDAFGSEINLYHKCGEIKTKKALQPNLHSAHETQVPPHKVTIILKVAIMLCMGQTNETHSKNG